ncbi:MAG: alpha/beta hydrolase [Pseudomonadota bacterium]
MIRFLQSCFIIGMLSLASASKADQAPYPPGFTASRVIDPATGKQVQVITGGKPGAPTVVLIHGLGPQASGSWTPVLPALAAHYQVLMFDLPGFGRSELPDAALSPKRYADLVHWLIAQQTSEPVFVVGHSLGGAIALRHSHDYPQQVNRLLLIDAAGILQTTVFTRHLSQVPGKATTLPLLRQLAERGSRLLNHVSGQFQDLGAGKAGALAAMAGSDQARGMLYKDSSTINAVLGLANEDFSPFVRELRVPVWMLWGELDTVAPLRTGQALRWLLPQSQLDILAEVGHVPMRDASAKTGEWLLKAMEEPLPSALAQQQGASQGDAVCKDKKDVVYRGSWRSIRLEHCTNVTIEQATLGQLVAVRSSVTIDNVSIQSQGTALEAKDANIAATGLRIEAPRAWNLDNSRLDLAAVQLQAAELGEDKNGSLLYLSLGHWCDGVDEWRLHGVWKTRAGKLEPQFRKARAGSCGVPGTPSNPILSKGSQ